jgi:AraC family transcriptional regulator of adaptative response/methylated-DNA-[protein]-cysteine methyltransferase
MMGDVTAIRTAGASADYARVERAIRFLVAHRREQPSLARVAAAVGLSEFHFQRMFERWAGVSPKRFSQLLTLEEGKRLLRETRSLLETSLELGLSGPSRLHDLFLAIERMTPGEYKSAARGLTIRWSVASTPLGPAVFSATDRGLCGVSFVGDAGIDDVEDELRALWPASKLERDRGALRAYADELASRLAGKAGQPLPLLLRGTPLQLKVWEALVQIPPGHVLAYSDVAKLAGVPRAVRAVASAVAANPIACLVPCHRVIHATGAFGQYHWGAARKAALLGLERARAS